MSTMLSTSRWPRFLIVLLFLLSTACARHVEEKKDSPVHPYLAGVVKAFNQGQTQRGVEVLLGTRIDEAAWKRTMHLLLETQNAAARTAAETYAQNLAVLQAMLELYRGDEERGGGHLPERLSDLIGTGGLTALPTCPSAGRDTYSAGYIVPRKGAPYQLSCSGHHHAAAGLKSGFPMLDPRFGVLMAEDQTATWWPGSPRLEVENVQRRGNHCDVTLREIATVVSGSPSASPGNGVQIRLVLVQQGVRFRLAPDVPLEKSGNLPILLSAYLDCVSHPVVAKTSRGDCELDLRRVATALEMWSSDHGGRYPGKLTELVPKYMWRLPGSDPEDNSALRPVYRPSADREAFDLDCTAHPDLHLSNRPGAGSRSSEDPGRPSPAKASPQGHLSVSP